MNEFRIFCDIHSILPFYYIYPLSSHFTNYNASIKYIQDYQAFHFAIINVKTIIISSEVARYSFSREAPPISAK